MMKGQALRETGATRQRNQVPSQGFQHSERSMLPSTCRSSQQK